MIRGDHGTENGLVARLVEEATDQESSFLYGKSTSNQVNIFFILCNHKYLFITFMSHYVYIVNVEYFHYLIPR